MNNNDLDARRPAKRILDDNSNHDVSSKKSKPNDMYYEDNTLQQFLKHVGGENQFVLDQFQKEAILSIEQKHSVFVAAPTSSGKTLIAHFGIWKALKIGKKTIITAPTKALCNQHFRDLCSIFPNDVGLITGDCVINSNANCIVMIPEILRKIIYDKNALIDEIENIIFDEIHHFNNWDRGGVYEESIIHIAEKVKFVFLSATVQNADEFTDWISSIQSKRCIVVKSDQRPVPLNFYFVPYRECTRFFPIDALNTKLLKYAMHFRESRIDSEIFGLETFRLILQKQFHPCIYFAFQRFSCEILADYFVENFALIKDASPSFLTDDEKDRIKEIWEKHMVALSAEDKKLQQVKDLFKFVQHGIGVHHAGLLPVLKEAVENLFCNGLIKVVFATDTLAMGINMPAKSVVFTTLGKGWDIYSNVNLIAPTDFIQMSGRAGRRGKDVTGNVIIMDNPNLTEENLNTLLNGHCSPIKSKLTTKNDFILNLINLNGTDSESILKKSFSYYCYQKTTAIEISAKTQELQNLLLMETDQEANYKGLQRSYYYMKADIEAGCSRVIGSIQEMERLKQKLDNHFLHETRKAKEIVENQLHDLNCTGLIFEFRRNKATLRFLNYLNQDDTLSLKGKIAAKIFTADGITLTELLSAGFFDEYDAPTIATLLSCFIYQYSSCIENNELFVAYMKMAKTAKETCAAHFIEPCLKNGRMKTTYKWVKEIPSFNEMALHANEGDLLQFFRNLKDLLQEMANAAAIMKNETLRKKFEEAREKVYRGIVASNSRNHE